MGRWDSNRTFLSTTSTKLSPFRKSLSIHKVCTSFYVTQKKWDAGTRTQIYGVKVRNSNQLKYIPIRVGDGGRTHNFLSHSQVVYQLTYTYQKLSFSFSNIICDFKEQASVDAKWKSEDWICESMVFILCFYT